MTELNDMKDFTSRKIEEIRRTYIGSASQVISDYEDEKRRTSDYEGRQLLELLQNADDEVVPEKANSVLIKYFNNKIVVANNGTPFSEDGVESLLFSSLSPKQIAEKDNLNRKKRKIGRMGLGFRSILSWADSIYIKSGGLSVSFSEENVEELYKLIVTKNKDLENKRLKHVSKIRYPIAKLKAPKIETANNNEYSTYDTYIEIQCKKDDYVKQDIEQQIDELDMETLLFLNNIEEIKIESILRNETIKKNVSEVKNNGEISIVYSEVKSIENKGKVEQKNWTLYSIFGTHAYVDREGISQKNDYEITVAYNKEYSSKDNYIYSYFKTDELLSFPFIVHATFELESNRKHLQKNSAANSFLIRKLAGLIANISEIIATNNRITNYEAVNFLAYSNQIPTIFEDSDFTRELMKLIKTKRVLPSTNESYLAPIEECVFSKYRYSEILPKSAFKNLIKFSDSMEVDSLIEKLSSEESGICFQYECTSFFKAIDDIAEKLTIEKAAKCIAYIFDEYKYEIKASTVIPRLLRDDNSETIGKDVKVFLPNKDDTIEAVPSFVNLKFINRRMYRLLKKYLSIASDEELAEELHSFNIREYNFEEIVKKAFNDIAKSGQKRISNIIQIVSWLFHLNAYETDLKVQDMGPLLIARSGKIINANEMYFGKEYNNKLLEALFEKTNCDTFLCDKNKFKISSNNFIKIVQFFKWLGVREYPRPVTLDIKNFEQKKYLDHCFSERDYIQAEQRRYDHKTKKLNGQDARINKVSVSSFDNFIDIIENTETEHIVAWIFKDENMRDLISSEVEIANSSFVEIDTNRLQWPRKILNTEMKSYVKWVFKNKNWVKTSSENKTNPIRCCFAIKDSLSPLIERPLLNYNADVFKKNKLKKVDVEHILKKTGVASEIRDLDQYIVYGTLAEFLNKFPGGEGVQSLYKLFFKIDEEQINEKARDSFIDKGCVYASMLGEKAYYPVKEVFYSDNRMYCEGITSQFPLIDLPKRLGQQKVNKIFGVKPLRDIEFKIIGEPILHKFYNEFAKEIDEFIPFVYIYRMDQIKSIADDNKNSIKNLEVILCEDISVQFLTRSKGEQHIKLKNFEHIFIENEKKVYLKAPPELHISEFRTIYPLAEAVAEIFSNEIKVEENRETYENLFNSSTKRRNSIIKSRFDDMKKLEDAKTALGISTDYKRTFWDAVLLSRDIGENLPEDENDLEERLTILLQLPLELQKDMFEAFDYKDPSQPDNFLVIVKLFNYLKMDICDYNQMTNRTINSNVYYNLKIEDLRRKYEAKYYCWLYTSLLDLETIKKAEFETKKYDYKILEINSENSIHYNYSEMFHSIIKVTAEELLDTVNIDLEEKFFTNKKIFKTHLEDYMYSVVDFENFCSESPNKSLLYFDGVESLISKFTKDKMVRSEFEKDTGDDLDAEAKENCAKDIFKEENEREGMRIINIPPKSPSYKASNRKNGQANRNKYGRLSDKEKNDIGIRGEARVYSLLKKKFSKVEWVSEYAKEAEVNSNTDDSLGYDIRYLSQDGRLQYVEVKSSNSEDIAFDITANEITFARQNTKEYFVYFVPSVEENGNPFNLGNLFDIDEEDLFSNAKFRIENKDYRIRVTNILKQKSED